MHTKYQGDDKDHCAVCGDKTGNNCLASGVYLIRTHKVSSWSDITCCSGGMGSEKFCVKILHMKSLT